VGGAPIHFAVLIASRRKALHVTGVWNPFRSPERVLVDRVEKLEDELKRLERRYVRLQGEFDGVNAHYGAHQNGAGDTELTKRLAALEEWAEQEQGA